MKRLVPNVGQGRAKQIVCTVSAAALMLGVSEAATIGFNFQCNYNGLTGSYSGSYVTASAFGISTNGWQSLTQMGTGYSTPVVSPLMETIDTTTSSGGLNPLPNGSLNVTWSSSSANVSGFGGYQAKPPHYTFGGNSYSPGEEQVYWGFLRDGVNYGPVADQPGWTVDITGLKSVFTNSSFVVQMIGAGDSIWSLTNVFVIDATLSSTQSVIYPNLPPVANQNGPDSFPRGIGGGLSTGSGPVDTDHLRLMSNQAQHATGASGFNNAGEVAGFIITDKPVVTMSPQPVLGGPGDSVTLNPYAIGVPPLAYQWRLNGTAVPNATNSSFAITSLSSGQAGNYDLVVTNDYGSVTSKVATVTEDMISLTGGTNYVADSNPTNAPRVGLNNGATWAASDSDGTTTRPGVMQFAAADTNQINLISVAGTTNFDVASGTIMFWMRSAGTDLNAPGSDGAALFGRPSSNSGNDFIVAQSDGGQLEFLEPNSSGGLFGTAVVSDNKWHLVALVFDQSASGGAAFYVDGVLDNTNYGNTASWSWKAGQQIELGSSGDTYWRAYDGLMDDVRFYSRKLSATEIASVYSTGALVDTANLQMQFNFDSAPGSGFALSWLLSGATLQSAPAVDGPYTDVIAAPSPYRITSKVGQKFYRYRFSHEVLTSNPYLM